MKKIPAQEVLPSSANRLSTLERHYAEAQVRVFAVRNNLGKPHETLELVKADQARYARRTNLHIGWLFKELDRANKENERLAGWKLSAIELLREVTEFVSDDQADAIAELIRGD